MRGVVVTYRAAGASQGRSSGDALCGLVALRPWPAARMAWGEVWGRYRAIERVAWTFRLLWPQSNPDALRSPPPWPRHGKTVFSDGLP